MFHAALWKLMWLQWRGGCRQFCRNLRTSRGLFYAGFLLLMLGYFVFSTTVEKKFSAVAPPHGLFAEDGLSDLIAFSLCAFTTWTVLFSTGEATVYFTASEIAFLFPAPFTRKQLLSYKLLKSFMGIITTSLFMSLVLAAKRQMWGAAVFGTMLAFLFLQLLAMNVAFVRQVLQEPFSEMAFCKQKQKQHGKIMPQ